MVKKIGKTPHYAIYAVALLITWKVAVWETSRKITEAQNQQAIDYLIKLKASGGDTSSVVKFVIYKDTLKVKTYQLLSIQLGGMKKALDSLDRICRMDGKSPLMKRISDLRKDSIQNQIYIKALVNAK